MDLEDLAHAHRAVAALARGLDAADWSRTTPCPDWDVAAVVRHLVVGEQAFTTSLTGVPYDLSEVSAEVDDMPDAVLPDVLESAGDTLREALAVAGPGEYPTGIGPLPLGAIAELRTIETLTHGWDVARATGRSLDVPEQVSQRALQASRRLMTRLPVDRTPFAPPQPVDDAAPAADRLAALLGRRPG
ncbi:TIGR03086 family protein [Nocardioides sp. dk4132]|uniref:TIGR03086 family metal-binding protein n=1 Tax=unclassified Nocardioides TaxID=2615069 RepID=UPI001297D7AE|nr:MULTISPECIES: TIGR03086 family metal-binding protein [unclassified Nocardioides]MQW75852.1 TIGR03086 family protein [Nocardioides sp. dk4132]QGA08721.1 TIGR03086 family protein [Nocardioides sp. dk884]